MKTASSDSTHSKRIKPDLDNTVFLAVRIKRVLDVALPDDAQMAHHLPSGKFANQIYMSSKVSSTLIFYLPDICLFIYF